MHLTGFPWDNGLNSSTLEDHHTNLLDSSCISNCLHTQQFLRQCFYNSALLYKFYKNSLGKYTWSPSCSASLLIQLLLLSTEMAFTVQTYTYISFGTDIFPITHCLLLQISQRIRIKGLCMVYVSLQQLETEAGGSWVWGPWAYDLPKLPWKSQSQLFWLQVITLSLWVRQIQHECP